VKVRDEEQKKTISVPYFSPSASGHLKETFMLRVSPQRA